MRSILAIALKDIKLLLRDRLAAFFVLGFPLALGFFFGTMMNPTSSSGRSKMTIAIVDNDKSKYSQLLVRSLEANKNLAVQLDGMEAARESVQSGKRTAMVVIPKNFGETAGIFWEAQPAIELGVDPSRSAEGAMLEGFLMEAVGSLVSTRIGAADELLAKTRSSIEATLASENLSEQRRETLKNFVDEYTGFVDSLEELQNQPEREASEGVGAGFQLANIEKLDVTRTIDPNSVQGQLQKINSRWDISFPQAMLWGILGCVAGFATSIAQERESGTLLRLRVAPIRTSQLLCGKALACFLSVLAVIALMTAVGYQLGMRPLSSPKLAFASVSVAICFVGIMMTLSTLGKSVQSVSGTGWAANMLMAMFGGCMIPVMFMPVWIANLSFLSPVRWAIQSLEGAIWRDFDWSQMLTACGVLIGVGIVGLMVGVWNSRKSDGF